MRLVDFDALPGACASERSGPEREKIAPTRLDIAKTKVHSAPHEPPQTRAMTEGGKQAIQADDDVVAAAEVKELKRRIRNRRGPLIPNVRARHVPKRTGATLGQPQGTGQCQLFLPHLHAHVTVN